MSFSDDFHADLKKISAMLPSNILPIIISTFYLALAAVTLVLLSSQLQLLANTLNMKFYSLISLILLAGPVVIFLVYHALKRSPATKKEATKAIDPHDANPVKYLLKGLTVLFVWLKRQAKSRPIIMALFGIFYWYPATILLLQFYGNPNFNIVNNWLLNKVFLPIADGLVTHGQAPFIAAIATGFLIAKVFFLIADFIEKSCSGEFKKSYIFSPLIYAAKKPISAAIQTIGMIALVAIFYGIGFFTHLAGNWVFFNLLAILIKLVAMIYDTANKPKDSLIAKCVSFPFLILLHFRKFLENFSKEFFVFILKLLVFPIRYVIWPVTRTYFEAIASIVPKPILKQEDDKRNGIDKATDAKAYWRTPVNILDRFDNKILEFYKRTKEICKQFSLLNWLLFAASIYTIIPVIYMISYKHTIINHGYTLFNKLLFALNIKTGITIPCLITIFALIFPALLILSLSWEHKHIRKQIAFTMIVAIVAIVSIMANNIALISNIPLYAALILVISALVTFFCYKNCYDFSCQIGTEKDLTEKANKRSIVVAFCSMDVKVEKFIPGDTNEGRESKTNN